ncbi:MAG: hypothetical protein KDE33_13560 [Bacteroidetes bacterium]|nr:hypothetical protein [Bacteroidota bacterium]MCB9226597.1 hypothetical protein [Chitinophagales bacterium]
MQSNFKTLVYTIILVVLGSTSFAQTFSPHSRFGIGNMFNPVFSANKAMGGISAGYTNSREINYLNPASYAAMQYTNFNIGLQMYGNTISSDSAQIAGSVNGGINNVALGFPVIMNHWGMAFGLTPFSYKKYNYSNTLTDDGTSYTYNNLGKGSTYKVFWGNGFEYKNFRFGVNAGFVFGGLDESQEILLKDTTSNINTSVHNELNLKDFTADFGVQYTFKISKLENQDKDKIPVYMTVGAYGAPPINIKSAHSKYNISSKTDPYTQEQYPIDSASGGFYNQKVQTKLPAYFGLGFTIGNELWWTAGADFHFENWKSYNSKINNTPLNNLWQLKIGGEIKPDFRSNNYAKQVNYRLGAQFGKSYVTHAGKGVPEFGMTFGFGLPLGKVTGSGSRNKINLAMEIGRRGIADINTYKENYYKLTLTYALSDRWFIKRKFD